jgi:hypothetical protein
MYSNKYNLHNVGLFHEKNSLIFINLNCHKWFTNENNYLDPVSIFQISNTICLKSEVKDKLVSEHMNSLYIKKKGSH